LRTVQAELARVIRLAILGQLTASIAHEVTQSIASARNNARAALKFLDRQPPDLGEVREAHRCVVDDANRAGDIIERIRDHIKKVPMKMDRFDLNEAIHEVILLARSAITQNGVSVQTRLAEGVPPVQGGRVQVQQAVLNLILNAIEAMGSDETEARELSISTEQMLTNGALVAVRDSGPGIDPENLERVFEATPPSTAEWGWGSRSAGPSSMLTRAGCGRTPMSLGERHSSCRAHEKAQSSSNRRAPFRHRIRSVSSTGLPR